MDRGPKWAESCVLEVQKKSIERNPEMGRNGSFEKRAREEVERIKAQEAAEQERKQARMRELAEQARERKEAETAEERRRKDERDAKLRRSQEEKAEGEERLARDSARRSWKASGGAEAAFEEAWPSMWEEMLKRRTVDADSAAREAMTRSSVRRIWGADVTESRSPHGGSSQAAGLAGSFCHSLPFLLPPLSAAPVG
jgi:colicin import membrane protein